MKTLTIFLMSFILFSSGKVIAGGVTIGNGGDAVAQEFIYIAQKVSTHLERISTPKFDSYKLFLLSSAIKTTKVESKEKLFLRGAEVDAINYPDLKKIEVSRTRWASYRDRADVEKLQMMLVLHEYIWIAGMDDTNYVISNQLNDLITQEIAKNSNLQGRMECAVLAYHAADFINPNIQMQDYGKVVKLKLDKEGAATKTVVINGLAIEVSIYKRLDAGVYSILLTTQGTGMPSSIIEDILLNDGLDREKGYLRYVYSQNETGFFGIHANFREALKKLGRFNQYPYNGKGSINAEFIDTVTEDVKNALNKGLLKPQDAVGIGTYEACGLFK